MQALVDCDAQSEFDALRDVQPMQFIVENPRQSAVKLALSSNDSRRSIHHHCCSFSVNDFGAFSGRQLQ